MKTPSEREKRPAPYDKQGTAGVSVLVRNNILNLAPYSSARDEYQDTEGVFLDANENPFGQYNRYPDPYQKTLKQRISDIKKMPVENIFIGNGSDEVIDLAFRIFCNPTVDKALTFTPTYGMYQVAADINDVELVKVPLDADFQINISVVRPYLSDSHLKLIFICSPNNPSGNLLRYEDINFLLNNFSGIVIIDEAYIDFSAQESWVRQLKNFPRLIISQTLSKAWGLAGIRLGLAFMSEEMLEYYNKVKPPYNISAASQEIALKKLSDLNIFTLQVQEILDQKKKVIAELEEVQHIRKIYPSHANFILVEVDNAKALYSRLLFDKVIIRNRDSVVENCVRITIGSAEENEKLIEVIKSIK